MRTAKANDHWRRSVNRQYTNYLKYIDLKDFIGIKKIEFGGGIQCICGLNGVGKSSVIAAIKSVIGLNVGEQDSIKIGDNIFQGVFIFNNEPIECRNVQGKTLLNQIDDADFVKYIDAEQSMSIMNYYICQENIEELLEQNEPTELKSDDIKDINYLVGREYKEVIIYELDDITDFDTIPYFIVKDGNISYDSRKMGLGEHFLLYMYWRLYKTSGKSLIIVEEPESYVGIKSQRGIMDIIAKKSSEEGCSFLITTHSPYILERVKNENVKILSRLSNMASIHIPQQHLSALEILGEKQIINVTIFVEDKVSKIFLKRMFERENLYVFKQLLIEDVGSASQIDKCLEFINTPKIKYLFVGVYDADQKERICSLKDKLNWPYTFLPVLKDVETEFFCFLADEKNLIELSNNIGRNREELIVALSSVSGEDCHDKLLDLCKYLQIELSILIRAFYEVWREKNVEIINDFILEIEHIIKKD